MKQSKILMGMTITVEIADKKVDEKIDKRFSTYKEDSEISKINRGELGENEWSPEMREVFELSEKTKKETDRYFDIRRSDGKYDTSGLVKGCSLLSCSPNRSLLPLRNPSE